MNEEHRGPLGDVRVIETGTFIAGPYCGQLLGDFGAEIMKLEDPVGGDPMRSWGPKDAKGSSLFWPIIARNKKSITCNLRTPQGQDLLRQLAATADVLLENFRPGTLEKWGLGYDELSEINPRLILVRITGFGQTGPYAQRAGFGAIGEAMGGLRYVTGTPDRPPSRAGISVGDSLAATFAAFGTVMALHARTRSGRGQVVDCAIYEAVLAFMESLLPEWHIANHQRERTGSVLPKVAPSNIYRCSDGEDVLIAANSDAIFGRLCGVMEQPGLAADERYKTHNARGDHQNELDLLIENWCRQYDSTDVLARLESASVPAGRIYRAADMFADPHFADREAIMWMKDPKFGDFPMQNVVPKLSTTPGSIRTLGPELGEQNQEVYGDLLGLDAQALDRLRLDGVI